jgi:hypothetical protein
VRGDKPLLTGPLRFKTKFELPPGDVSVVERLKLEGSFHIDDGEFKKSALQDKIDSLSRKGQGQPENMAIQDAASDLSGNFALAGGIISFRNLRFHVSGATVQLDGGYGLRDESLDFRGELRLSAKVSETTTGFKALLLKAIDPLFSRSKTAGSVVPIKISGTRSKPNFGLDVGKTIKPGD